MYIDEWDIIVNGRNVTYLITIKLMSTDVKSSIYIDFGIGNNDKDPKFKVLDHFRISKYKNILAKVYFPNWSEEVAVIKKVKTTILWRM